MVQRTAQSDDNKMPARISAPFIVYLKELFSTEQAIILGKRIGMCTGQLFGCNSYWKSFTPFCTTTLDNQSTIFGCHPDEKSVSSFSWCITWLKSPFHLPAPYCFHTDTLIIEMCLIHVNALTSQPKIRYLVNKTALQIALHIKSSSASLQPPKIAAVWWKFLCNISSYKDN